MHRWAVVFLCLAALCGLIGFSVAGPRTAELAQVACYVFLVVFLVLIVTNFLRGGAPKERRAPRERGGSP